MCVFIAISRYRNYFMQSTYKREKKQCFLLNLMRTQCYLGVEGVCLPKLFHILSSKSSKVFSKYGGPVAGVTSSDTVLADI